MVINAKENSLANKMVMIQEEMSALTKATDSVVAKAAEEIRTSRDRSFAVQPGVPVGTDDPSDDEKVVYLTFDDGPSENTKKIIDILAEYDAKATFFITGANEECRPYIKEAYEAGHTIGLHTYTHDYAGVYASEEAYFDDLEKVGEVAKEQIGYVPCFIRFPGGSSNMVSAKYSSGLMTKLVDAVQEKGYQYYDWNLDSGDAAGAGKDAIEENSTTEKLNHVMLLCHDTQAKDATVEALPYILKYYTERGYEFRGIDRTSITAHHGVQN
ncbi:MAG TPA: polysaccharide deacetylase [Candidatus Mediterraneibacter quadrami]|uniref:Polysaccharide deacetylase n=1 Tax=Candidatus Mediterraneibacter quadrami TaxID=2838684 RepID=A0A9D2U8U9_9FIRM|nr:polysaccharide deacetylase [Candidatus Mediterraneibacter quadrami]